MTSVHRSVLHVTAVRRLGIAVGAAALVVGGALAAVGEVANDTAAPAVPTAECGPGSMPETSLQGRVPAADYASGRVAQGYTCNARQLGHHGATGGFKTLRYTDSQGNTCAFYDSTRMLGLDAATNLFNGTGLGTVVLDMSNPAAPRKTANLVTPAMLQPHESLLVNHERGLLVAVMGTAVTAPGILDVYDVRTDCRKPRLLSSTPSGLFGHESGLSPDGKTFWSVGSAGYTLTAVDLTDPRLPRILLVESGMVYHGVRLSADGRTMYATDMGKPSENSMLDNPGLDILDVSEVQDRKPSPKTHLLSEMTWSGISIPQVAEPFTRNGRQYLLEVDEFTDWFGDGYKMDFVNGAVGAARIIDVDDPRKPFVVSDVRLEVHEPENRTPEVLADPGASNMIGGYAAHYCSVASRDEPSLAACSMLGSGLRVFDISDVENPREVAYFNKPGSGGANAMSAPAWDPDTDSVWYTDGSAGFFAVQLTNGVEELLAPGRAPRFPCGADPARAGKDTDRDGLTDRREVRGIKVRQRVHRWPAKPSRAKRIGVVRTNPCRKDTDRDGLSDRREVRGIDVGQRVDRSRADGGDYRIGVRRTDPTRRDTDRDGLSDRQEVTGSANRRHDRRRSDPTRADTDFAGVRDGGEVRNGSDPTRAGR